MDFRVSVLPTLFGEKIVLRLLDKSNLQLDMTKLGFEQPQLDDFQDCDPPALRHGAGHRPDRLGQDDDALLGARRAQQDQREHLHRRGPVEFNLHGHQPGADARGHRAQLRGRAALLPAPGPRHHHGRRDPRLRDRRDRGQGGAHRPPGALDAAHQRRAVAPINRLLNMGVEPFLVAVLGQLHRRPAPRAPDLRGVQGARRRGHAARRCSTPASTEDEVAKTPALQGHAAAATAPTPATRAASRSTRSCRSREELKEFVLNGASAARAQARGDPRWA